MTPIFRHITAFNQVWLVILYLQFWSAWTIKSAVLSLPQLISIVAENNCLEVLPQWLPSKVLYLVYMLCSLPYCSLRLLTHLQMIAWFSVAVILKELRRAGVCLGLHLSSVHFFEWEQNYLAWRRDRAGEQREGRTQSGFFSDVKHHSPANWHVRNPWV